MGISDIADVDRKIRENFEKELERLPRVPSTSSGVGSIIGVRAQLGAEEKDQRVEG